MSLNLSKTRHKKEQKNDTEEKHKLRKEGKTKKKQTKADNKSPEKNMI